MGAEITTFLGGATNLGFRKMKHAFITGGAKRVGREIALHLAAQGYNITIHANKSKVEAQQTLSDIAALGVNAHIEYGDLNEPQHAGAMLQSASKQLGAITLLVNNASIFFKDELANVTVDSLQAHMNINCFSAIMLTNALAAQANKAQAICLLDGMNSWSISPNFLSYSLSKLALEQFIKLQAAQLAPNMRLNGIALGSTLEGELDSNTFTKTARLSPLKRNSNPQEVCETIMFLEKSPSITGQIIALSNGFNLVSPAAARF